MSKTKIERKLKVGNWDGQGKKQGRTASNRASKRNKKRSIKQKLDKMLRDGFEKEELE